MVNFNKAILQNQKIIVMKKVVFFLIFSISIFSFVKSQSLKINAPNLKNDSIIITESKYIQVIPIEIEAVNYWDTTFISLFILEGMAKENEDFSLKLTSPNNTISKTSLKLNYELRVMPDTLNEELESRSILIKAVSNGKEFTKTFILVIIDKDFVKKDDTKDNKNESDLRSLTYINAANFDFANTQKDISYVGNLNIFAPKLSPHYKFGFNAGIFKINYQKNDSLPNSSANVEILARGIGDSLVNGSKYRREVNEYYKKVSNKDISIYFQPIYWINSTTTSNNYFFAHLHTEFLISNWEIENSYATLSFDSLVYNNTPTNPLQPGPSLIYKYKKTFNSKFVNLSGNFGAGVTYIATPFTNSKFFLQSTIGYSTLGMNVISYNDKYQLNKGETSRYLPEIKTLHFFYLFRSSFTHQLSNNSEIIIGADIRGYLPSYTPKYAIYIGLKLKLDESAKTLSN